MPENALQFDTIFDFVFATGSLLIAELIALWLIMKILGKPPPKNPLRWITRLPIVRRWFKPRDDRKSQYVYVWRWRRPF